MKREFTVVVSFFDQRAHLRIQTVRADSAKSASQKVRDQMENEGIPASEWVTFDGVLPHRTIHDDEYPEDARPRRRDGERP